MIKQYVFYLLDNEVCVYKKYMSEYSEPRIKNLLLTISLFFDDDGFLYKKDIKSYKKDIIALSHLINI